MPPLYLAILDTGTDTEVRYASTLSNACQWVKQTLADYGCRTIEHSSHIADYVTSQGGYHAPSVIDEHSDMPVVERPFVTITSVYHTS